VLVDTHCHLDLLDDPEGALARMRAAGVGRAVTIGVDGPTSEWAVRFAAAHEEVWATVGLHPHDARERTDALMERIEALARDPRVVGIGEAGLDYHYDNSPRDRQRVVFAEQIAMAKRVGKALVVHSRDAWEDTFAVLEREGPPARLVFHCWSGSPESARRAVALGGVVSFSGTVTFRNAPRLRAACEATPLDRIVVETDAPFLSPHPLRGRPNEPANVRLVAEEVARVKGVPLDVVAAATTRTAARVFGWTDLPC
jgi:TatD DNase family protein